MDWRINAGNDALAVANVSSALVGRRERFNSLLASPERIARPSASQVHAHIYNL
jgi:hypothetical protein